MQRVDLQRNREARSRPATPGSAIWRTIVSRRGSKTVAARCDAPASCKNRAYSKPHWAAGRWPKSRMVVAPTTSMPLGRTRAAVTSRFCAPISMPTPEPKAAYFLRSVTLRGPGIVIPAQHIDPGAVVRPPETYRRGHNPPQVRELAIGQADARGGAESKNRLTANAQARVAFAAAGSKTRDFTGVLERLQSPTRSRSQPRRRAGFRPPSEPRAGRC